MKFVTLVSLAKLDSKFKFFLGKFKNRKIILRSTKVKYTIISTLCGRPMSGFSAHRLSITSLMRCFCPLYVVRIEMRSAGQPISRIYMNTATTYSASARF